MVDGTWIKCVTIRIGVGTVPAEEYIGPHRPVVLDRLYRDLAPNMSFDIRCKTYLWKKHVIFDGPVVVPVSECNVVPHEMRKIFLVIRKHAEGAR